ncbi:MAG: lamin tail domain-containing protein [Clostridiales bacterium]|nr:lamin tail domain-containing protein [Clostridiales bacterium]
MADRYTKKRNPQQRDQSSARRTQLPPERSAPVKTYRTRKSRFNIILIAVVLILAYFGLEPLFRKTTTETQPVISVNGETKIVDFPVISEVMSSNRNSFASEDGQYYDWIELYNPTENNINLSGFALSDNMSEPAKHVLSSIVMAPGDFVIIFASSGANEGALHAPFGISASGEDLFLADPYANIVDTVSVEHLSPNFSYMRNLAELGQWAITEFASPGFFNDQGGYDEYLATRRVSDSNLKINEVMSSNLITIADEDGDYSDWVELTNVGADPLDISGYALSDNESAAREWIFPDNTIMQPNELIIVFLSGKDKIGEEGEFHASFRLNSMKDTILCANLQGQVLDVWEILEPGDDISVGLDTETGQRVFLSHPTPGYINNEDGYNQFQQNSETQTSGLILTEIMLGNDQTLTDNFDLNPDWIEIYNNTEERIELSGYGLSDNSAQLGKWKFPDSAFIEPNTYKLVYASGMGTETDSTSSFWHTNFSLDIVGEPVVLTNSDGKMIDKCILTSIPFDISYGRQKGSQVFEYMLSPSPGEENGNGYSGFAPTPYIPLAGGVYADPQIIEINIPEGCTVRYTLDCSDPTDRAPVYEGPFQVSENTVVRARAFKDGKLDSIITTQTYFINVNHELPIVSISTDPDNLYSDHSGIMAFGDSFSKKYPFKDANFYEDWEVGAYIEMYEIDGSQVLNQNMGLRVFGAYSRAEIAKNFTLVARAKYGAETFDYAIFPDRAFTEYKSVILRNGASEWYASKIVDTSLTSLAADTTDLDVQAYYPVAYYLNGEYWGVYFFREKINKYYLQQHHDIDPENVDIIYGNGKYTSNALAGDISNWQLLKEFVTTHDLSKQENYDIVKAWIDVDNYMDMVINEIYVGNTDTGNIKCYRERLEDAKWRWFYYDVDWSFSKESANSLVEYLNPEGHGNGNAFETWLILGLLENNEFEQSFIERFAYHITVTYEPSRVINRIDQIVQQIDFEMHADRETWNARFNATPDWYKEALGSKYARSMGYTSWANNQIPRRKTFAQKRPDVIKIHLKEYFDLSAEDMARLFD